MTRRVPAPWLVLAALLVVPALLLAGWWLVARSGDPTQAAAPVAAVDAPVTHEDVRAQAPVTVKLTDAPGREVTVRATGTVTAAALPGTVLRDGTVALRVDDRPIRAMVAPAPLWRPLGPGVRGADVARLEQYLVATGYYRGRVTDAFSAAVGAAVAAFNVDAGLGRAVTTFDPATVLWVGPEPLTTAASLAPEGTSVAPGTAVLRGPGRHDAVVVTEPQGGASSAGSFGATADLVVGKASAPYVPGSGSITDPKAVAAVAAALAPATDGTAVVRARTAQQVAVVPASALVQGADGSTCVYESVDAPPVVVSPVGGGVGTAQLPADLDLARVLVNPGLVAPRAPCGS